MRQHIGTNHHSRWAAALLAAISTILIASPVAAAGSAYLVRDINGARSGSPMGLTAVGSSLFFAARTYKFGYELWKSDGTEVGTTKVKDVYPGRSGSFPTFLVNVAGTVFFAASDPINGRELWKSDGTANGTVVVANVRPGATSSDPEQLTAVGNRVFFTADTGMEGRELWVSDGTSAGTHLVKDVLPGASDGLSPCQSFTCVDTWEPDPALVAVANKLFFRAVSSNGGTPRLWVTDGTEQGTTRVKDKDGHIVRKPHGMAAVGSTLFLRGGSAQDPSLWKSDGTTAGTRMVSDVDPFRLTNVDGTLFFRSRYFDTYYEQWLESDVWKSDGTAAGTVRVKEVLRPGFLVAVGSELYFTSGPSYPDDTTIKLWKSDGSGVGTNPVADVDPQFTSLVAVGNRAYFTLEDSTLHRSDGTAVEAVTGGLYPGGVTDVAGKAFFTAYLPRSQSELWAVAGK